MIKKLWILENNFSLFKAAFIIGFFSLITKLFAIYRLQVFGSTFGQDRLLDTYYSAFRIPDIITNLLVLTTLSIAFLPIFTDLSTKSEEQANELANTILNSAILSIGFLALVFLILSKPLTHYLVPGFSEEHFKATLNLTRLFLISPLIFAASTVFGGILNAKKQFLITSFAPILYTLGVISGAKLFYPRFGIVGLGYGVIAGAFAQMLIQFFVALRYGYSWNLKLNFRNESIRKFFSLYIPRILSLDLVQVTLLLGSIIGSTLVAGSITALNQAYDLQSTPLGIFAYAIALASFPVLSEYFALKNELLFLQTLQKTISQVLFFMLPISILTLLFRAHIVRLILGFGKFTWEDTIMTFTILGIFSFSLWSQSITILLSRAFFARQNTRIPVAINLLSLGLNLGLGVFLGRTYGVYGLTAAFVLASICNAVLLFTILRRILNRTVVQKEALHNFDRELASTIIKIMGASLIMGLVGYASLYFFEPLLNNRTVFGLFMQAGASGSLAVIAFLVSASYFELPQAKKILGKLTFKTLSL